LAAHRGETTLLVRIDESLHRASPATKGPKPSKHGFDVLDLEPQQAMDDYVEKVVRLRPLVERITGSEIYKKFFAAAPGLKELVLLGRIKAYADEERGHQAPRYTTIVVDCPSSGHGLLMLETPYAAFRAMPVGPFARLASEIIEWLESGTHIALVAIPEEMAVVEAIEFRDDLMKRTRLVPSVAFLNRMRQEKLSPEAHAALIDFDATESSPDRRLLECATRVHRRSRLEAFHEKRLAKGLGIRPLRVAELSDHGPASIAKALSGVAR
jgi:anion-transporting  ArsA/GET3 family ATPase